MLTIVLAVAVALALVALARRQGPRALPRRARPPRSPQAPTDVRALFAAREIDGYDLTVEAIGKLHLPTGRILACDPLVFAEDPPLERSVPPGDYPVAALVARKGKEELYAALRIVFASGAPARYEPAGDYGVDAGLGCFMDAATAPLFLPLPEDDTFVDTTLLPSLARSPSFFPRANDPRNAIIVASGYGDGLYRSTWALSETGQVLWLVTDFAVVTAPGAPAAP